MSAQDEVQSPVASVPFVRDGLAGKSARQTVPRSVHAGWSPHPGRRDPVAVLKEGDVGRLPELVPIRYSRMLVSPFTFYRGAAAIMAADLAHTPVSGFRTQLCGDAHLLNFGAYASPERRLVFDVNDFDETLRGPWEWDLKRLAASVVVAARHLELRRAEVEKAVRACVRSYREHMLGYSRMHVLDLWYARLDADMLAGIVASADARHRAEAASPGKKPHVDEHVTPQIAARGAARHAIVDRPPLVFHPADRSAFFADVRRLFERYRMTLSAERRSLFERYDFVDAAYKVVGVGSVGMRCLVALLSAGDGDTLLLQIKEARQSVLEPFAGFSGFGDGGERVVRGQSAMQAASDIFLGWARDEAQRGFYVRQAHDMKTSANVERMTFESLRDYVTFCGWALARAHARAGGNAIDIASYVGRSAAFDDALVSFANAYADQNEKDYTELVAAVKAGRIEVAASP